MERSRNHLLITIVVAAGLVPGSILAVATWVEMRAQLGSPLGDATAVRDYLNIWAAGRLIVDGGLATLFHPGLFYDWLCGLFGADLRLHTWSYPPTMAMLAVPFSLLPLLPGFLAWTAGSAAILGGVLRRAGLSPAACLAVVLSPAVIENALAGQNGALTASLLEGGLLLLGRAPVVSGVLFGLLTAKPHLGLLVPVCLLASGNWRSIAAACATALLLTATSGLAFGLHAWGWYLTDVRQFMTEVVLAQPYGETFQTLMATPFVMLRWAGASLPAAYAGQAAVTAACVALTWWAWRLPGADPKARVALTAALAPLATPYAYSYDTVGVAVAVAVLTVLAAETGFRPYERLCLVVGWLWPGLAFWMGFAGLPPVGCLTLAAVAACAASRLVDAPARRPRMLAMHHA